MIRLPFRAAWPVLAAMRVVAVRFAAMRVAAVLTMTMVAVTGCSPDGAAPLQGYAEAEYRYLASPVAGTLHALQVKRGDVVAAGAPLFALDPAPEADEVNRLGAQREQQLALIANLRAGQRPDELAVLRAQAEQAAAQLTLSKTQWQRVQELGKQNLASRDQIDAARTQLERDDARDQEAKARLRVAKLGARDDEVRAAEAQLQAIDAQLDQARWQLAQKALQAPVAGRVQDTLYQPGEFVAAGKPAVVLLPEDAIKVRFYVPQALRSQLDVGKTVQLSCDGCGATIPAEVRFVADSVEYTPPVLFNRDNRAALVYRAEAWPVAPGARLQPGQPVDVHWQ